MAALLFLAITPAKSHAQISVNIEANIPFAFHVGDATDLTVIENSSVDGSTSAPFDVGSTQANSAPPKTELIFNKYWNSYYLTKVFDEGNNEGSRVVESRYQKKENKEQAATEEHVAGHQSEPGD